MAGHSHWAKIKRAKSTTDARRGSLWSKLARRIIVAAKVGGGNPDENLQLRYAIDEARAEKMPRDTIQNAIKKGTGELGAAQYERILYEGYGPNGVALMIEVLTDNRSRTAPELRKIFERGGGQLGATNCVAWMFSAKGVFIVSTEAAQEDALIELCLDAGADDVQRMGEVFEITSQIPQFAAVKDALAAKNIPTLSAQMAMVPSTTVRLTDEKTQKVLGLIEKLEENEDVQNVYSNLEISDEATKTS